MMDERETAYLRSRAYVPEHVAGYVTAVSRMEPFLVGDFLVYTGEGRMVFVGYPLNPPVDAGALARAWKEATTRYKAAESVFVGAELPARFKPSGEVTEDQYYLLDLERLRVNQKVRNMLTRARREVTIGLTRDMNHGHAALVASFLHGHQVEPGTATIFSRIAEYVGSVPTAWLIEARDREGGLVAFDVAELGPAEYAFYMFNFRSPDRRIPGASDLLLEHLVDMARAEGKRKLNLGLGINAGVTRFKTKWGARPFLKYLACTRRKGGAGILSALLDKL